MRRLMLALAVAAGLAPGTWWRSLVTPDRSAELTVTELTVGQRGFGPLHLVGAWRLESPNEHFHGYSGLVVLDDGRLLAASDRGRMLLFSPPGRRWQPPRFDHFAGEDALAKHHADLEALTRDPLTGRIWVAYEVANLIRRFDRDLTPTGDAAPRAMRDWPVLGGPEAMTRLADGRFIVLSEGDPSFFAKGTPGLLFSGDPVEGAEPVAFRFRATGGFRPVDMAQLPDGRVLILLRAFEWGLPPRFRGKLALADPAAIVEGGEWEGAVIADLEPPLPTDNYEGLAIEPAEAGGAAIWLISDDNEMRFQRTLLLKFLWRPNEEGARIAPRASSIR